MHHKTCSNSTFSMRHNAMFEGCWAERLFLKYQNIKICAWKWWAEYLKYLNIQKTAYFSLLHVPKPVSAPACSQISKPSTWDAFHRWALTVWPLATNSLLLPGLKHQHRHELKPHHHHVQNYQPHQYFSKFSRRPAPLYSAASLFLFVIFQISKCFMCTQAIKWRTQSFKATNQPACQRVDCRK